MSVPSRRGKHDEDTGRRVLTLDDRELGWHRAPISRIHDDDVGLSHGRLGKRLQIVDFNGRDLSAARAENVFELTIVGPDENNVQ